MWNWLRNFFATPTQIESLRQQRDSALADVAVLATRVKELEAKLFDEIDTNRSREDALTNSLVGLVSAGGTSRVPRHSLLGTGEPERDDPEPQPGDRAMGPGLKEAVDQRVDEFAANASHRYSDGDRAMLRAHIEANPREYGIDPDDFE